MKNLKKALAMVLALCLVLSTFTAMTAFAAFEDVAGTEYEEAVGVLVPLGIVAGYEDGTYGPDKTVTRAEMSAFIVRELGLADSAAASAGTTKFTDVAADHWASGSINIATNKGIIVGYGDGTFGPEDPVTFEQAVKMVVCMLGYELKAKQNGGYPEGYLIEATHLQLTSGMKFAGNDPAKRGTIAKLLYNALEVPLMEMVVYSGDQVELQETGKTLLNDYLYVYKLFGMVIATDKAALVGTAANVDEARLYWSSTFQTYTAASNASSFAIGDTNPADFFGQSVKFYYFEDKNNADKDTLLTIVPNTAKNKTLTLSPDQIDAFASGSTRLEYRPSATSSKKDWVSVNVRNMMLNNMPYAGVDANTVIAAVPNGDIQLIDVNGDNTYDNVIVKSYLNGVVAEVDEDENEVTFSTGATVTLDAEKMADGVGNVFTITDKDGAALELADLEKGMILSVYTNNVVDVADAFITDFDTYVGAGASFFEIIACTDTVEGAIEEVDSIGKKIVISGTAYPWDRGTNANMFSSSDLEAEGTFYLDFAGKVVKTDLSAKVEDYALVYQLDTNAVNFTYDVPKELQLSVVNSDGSKVDYQTASKFDIIASNGLTEAVSTYDASKIDASHDPIGDALVALNANALNQLVSFKLDANGKIKKIYLAATPAASATDGFAQWATGTYYYNPANGVLAGYVVNDSTKIFELPNFAAASTDADDVTVYGKSGLKKDNILVRILDVDKKGNIKAMVVQGATSKVDDDSAIAIIKSVSTIKNADGDRVYKVYMIQNGQEVVVTTEDDTVFAKATATDFDDNSEAVTYGAYAGQVIAYKTSPKGEMLGGADKLWRLYPRATSSVVAPDYFLNSYYQTWNYGPTAKNDAKMHIIYGNVAKKDADKGTLIINTINGDIDSGAAATSLTVLYSGANVTVVDYSLDSAYRVQVGSMSDVKAGNNVVIRNTQGVTKDIVVYKSFNPLG